MTGIICLFIILLTLLPRNAMSGINRALHIPPAGGYAEITDGPLLRGEHFTIEAWIKRDPFIINSDPEYPIISKSGISIRAVGSSFPHNIVFSLEGDGGANLSSQNMIWPDRWYHIAAVYDGSIARLLVNGIVVDSTDAAWSYPEGYGSLIVGEWIGSYFHGLIDELKFWNIARTPHEIRMAMHRLPPADRNGLTGYWKFDEVSGTEIADSSGNNNPGQLRGSAVSEPADTPFDPVLVAKPENIHVTVEGSTAKLTWAPSVSPDLFGYNVYRDTEISFLPDSTKLIAFVDQADSSFEQSLPENDAGYFKVVAVDSGMNYSEPGLPAFAHQHSPPDSIDVLASYYLWNDTSGSVWNNGYLRKYLSPPQLPALGEYSVFDSTIIRQHIDWSETYGIDVWMTDWPGINSPGDRALQSVILPQLLKSDLRFCIQYDVKNLLDTKSGYIALSGENLTTMEQHFSYLAAKYFDHEKYCHYSGMPVVFIRSSALFTDNSVDALDQIRSAVNNAGFNLFIIGDEIRYRDLYSVAQADSDRIKAFDAISAYSTHRKDNHTPVAFNENLTELGTTFAFYKSLADGLSVRMIPTVIPGYNDRGIHPSVSSGITPWYARDFSATPLLTLESQLQTAVPFIDDDLRILIATSFNGFHEDTQLEPVAPSYFTSNDISGAGLYTGGFLYRGRGNEPLSTLKNILKPGVYKPVAFKDKVHVAVYYYQWYGLGWEFHWKPYPSYLGQVLDPPFHPLLGEYDSDNPETIRQHIEWSEQYGIDSWILVYPGSEDLVGPTQAILNELEGHNITFSFLHDFGLTRLNCDNGSTLQQVENAVGKLADGYFGHPNYWKIDGRPVLVFYLANNYSGDCVSMIDKLRTYIRDQKGFEMYLFGDVTAEIVVPELVAPWDGYTGYVAAPTIGYSDLGSYSPSVINSFRSLWEYLDYSWWTYSREAGINDVDFMPSISPGYNDRPVRPEKMPTPEDPLILSVQTRPGASHTSTFEKMIDVASRHIHQDRPMIVVNSFNEWHEGTAVEPTTATDTTSLDTSLSGIFYTQGFSYAGYNFDYLDIIRDRFGTREINDIEKTSQFPGNFALFQNYPNPFNASTTIQFQIPARLHVKLGIYDLLGRKVDQPVDKIMNPGLHHIIWAAKNLASGVYFYKLHAGTVKLSRKLVLLK